MPSTKSAAKAERLFNLVIALLNTDRFRDQAWIRAKVEGYRDASSDEAFFRMFERDKTELRDLGIPLQTSADGAYRIVRGEFEMPAINFTVGEKAALALAGRLWETSVLGDAGREALRKLGDASGDALDASLLPMQPRVRTADPAFQPLYAAIRKQSTVQFDYRKGNSAAVETRRVQPWGLVSWRGRWYLVGQDTDRREHRTFRLSRIVGDVVASRPGSVRVPPDVDLLALVSRVTAPVEERRSAVLRVAPGAAAGLRRLGRDLPGDGAGPPLTERIEIPIEHLWDAARLIAAVGPDAVVESPTDLRDAVVRLLTEAAGPAGGEEPAPQLTEVTT